MATEAKGAPQKATGPKVLRVGIIRNGRPIEEQLFRKKQNITIGQSAKQTFCIPVSEVPKEHTLFEVKNGSYFLSFSPQMAGRVSLGDRAHDLESLKKSGKARAQGPNMVVQLNEAARGKIVMGDVTVLFQFVVPPPARPKAPLPASMRGGFIQGMDWNFTIAILISALVQGGTVVWLENTDWPEPRNVGIGLPDRFVEILKPPEPEPEKEKEKPPEEVVDPDAEKQAAKDAEEEKKPKKKAPPKKVAKPSPQKSVDPDKAAKREAARKRAMAKNVEDKTILKQIGTIGGEGKPSLVDSLRGGATRKDLDDAFAGSSGVAKAEGTEERSGLRRGGSSKASGVGEKAGIGDLKGPKAAAAANAGVKTGSKREGPKVKAKLRAGGGSVAGSGVVDKAAVASTIRRRQGALIGCYERELKKNPGLKGKLVVRFTIGTAGRVTSASISSSTLASGAVGSCVTGRVKSWRFPKPEGGSVTVSKTFVFSPSN